jgi:hypothetical protein
MRLSTEQQARVATYVGRGVYKKGPYYTEI